MYEKVPRRTVQPEEVVDQRHRRGPFKEARRTFAKQRIARKINSERSKAFHQEAREHITDPRLVELCNNVLGRFMKEVFGMDYAAMRPSQFRSMSELNLARDDLAGGYVPNKDVIYVNEKDPDAGDLVSSFRKTLHEMIHATGAVKFADRRGKDPLYKGGYTIVPDKNPIEQMFSAMGFPMEKLNGFNEGIVEAIMVHILRKYDSEIFDSLKKIAGDKWYDSKEDMKADIVDRYIYNGPYGFLLESVDRIIADMSGVGEDSEQNARAIRKDLERGHFDGSMMHLRRIEDHYGPGTLAMLASVKSRNYDEERHHEEKENIKLFFNAPKEDWALRLSLASKIALTPDVLSSYIFANVQAEMIPQRSDDVASAEAEHAIKEIVKRLDRRDSARSKNALQKLSELGWLENKKT